MRNIKFWPETLLLLFVLLLPLAGDLSKGGFRVACLKLLLPENYVGEDSDMFTG